MREKDFILPLALILILLCPLGGCAPKDSAQADLLSAYDGIWYFAKNGVACKFGDGKIYRDDNDAKEGQTLTGIYAPAEDHIDAHITNTGGLKDPKPLYIVPTEEGDVLCDSADGDGTVYFYREPLAVLAVLEVAEQDPPSDLPAASAPASPSDLPLPSQGPDDPETSPSPLPFSEAAAGSQMPDPQPSAEAGSSSVWVSKSGSKYHRDPSCSGMKSPSKISKSEALDRGLTPCKRCY